jgi:hypothetical protein
MIFWSIARKIGTCRAGRSTKEKGWLTQAGLYRWGCEQTKPSWASPFTGAGLGNCYKSNRWKEEEKEA